MIDEASPRTITARKTRSFYYQEIYCATKDFQIITSALEASYRTCPAEA